MKCCHTSVTTLTTNFTTNYGGNSPVTVYGPKSQYIAATANTWFGFTFDTPFYYDGSNNLIMEVNWSGDSGGYAYCRSNSVAGRFIYMYNGNGPYAASYFHYQRITIAPGGMAVSPTSLGRVKALYN